MKFTYTFTCRIFHANIMQIKPPITYSYLLMKSQHSISRRPHQNMYTYQITLLYCQILVYKDAFQHQSWCIQVARDTWKNACLTWAISYAILKSFTEIGRNFVAALCNSISLRLFIDLLSEHTHSMGSWLRDLQILCIWKDFESGYFANTNQDLFVNGFQCKLIKHPMIDTNR